MKKKNYLSENYNLCNLRSCTSHEMEKVHNYKTHAALLPCADSDLRSTGNLKIAVLPVVAYGLPKHQPILTSFHMVYPPNSSSKTSISILSGVSCEKCHSINYIEILKKQKYNHLSSFLKTYCDMTSVFYVMIDGIG